MCVTLVVILIFEPIVQMSGPNKKVYIGNLRRFETNPPNFKISLEKCSNLDYDYKWILKGCTTTWNDVYVNTY